MARLQGGERRLEPRRSHQGVHHHVDVVSPGHVDERLPPAMPGRGTGPSGKAPRAPGEDRDLRVETPHLVGQERLVAVTGQRDDLEPIRVAPDHLERAPTDRPRRSEDRDPDHRVSSSRESSPYASGSVKTKASIRSSTPP